MSSIGKEPRPLRVGDRAMYRTAQGSFPGTIRAIHPITTAGVNAKVVGSMYKVDQITRLFHATELIFLGEEDLAGDDKEYRSSR